VFLRDGLKSVRIGPLAAEARCSRRTLYELAASKEDLFVFVLDRIMRRIARQGRDAIDHNNDPVQRIIAMGTAAAEGIGALTPPFMQAVQGHPPARALFDNHVTAARTTLETLIEDAIDQHRFRQISPSIAADAVLALVLHFTDAEHARSKNHTPADALRLVFDVFIAGAEQRP
jgi:AcrR family transcriptional regulator